MLTVHRAASTRLQASWNAVPERPFWRAYWNSDRGASVTLAGRRFDLGPHAVLLIPPATPVVQRLERLPVRTFYIHFAAGAPWDGCRGRLWQVPVRRLGRRRLAALAAALPAGGPEPGPRQRLLLHGLLADLLLAIPEHALPPAGDPAIARLRSAVADDPAGPWTAAGLADAVGLPLRTLQRRCRAAGAGSPRALVIEARVLAAMRLLDDPQRDIDAVAAACGFADRHHLSRRFAERCGCGPAAWRRRPW